MHRRQVLVGALVAIGSAVPARAVARPSGRLATATPVYGYRIVRKYPHDPNAFTEGLAFARNGGLYESTGLFGESTLRRVELTMGRVQRSQNLDPDFFGEGIVVAAKQIYQLTWQNQTCLVYDRKRLKQTATFSYPTEGWGLTTDGKRFIMSDGTSTLSFRDLRTFAEIGTVDVHDGDQQIFNLNELEFVRGEVWANVWLTDRIARIDPATGNVVGWIDLSGLLPPDERPDSPEAVLNGIAYDSARKRIFVTGKLWPTLFQIELIPPP